MPDHARLSPSAASRWMACTASIAMEESLPKANKDSIHSREGTAAHELAQKVLESSTDNPRDCEDFVGAFMSNDWEVTRDMAHDTQKYVDTIKQYAKDNYLFIEKRVDFSTVIDVPFCFGTADAVIITGDGKELMICDLKFGRGVQVYAEKNEQLMIYALGALREYGLVYDIERVRLIIHQPRLHHLSEWDCTIEELVAFSVKLREKAKRAISLADTTASIPLEDFAPGEKQCRWCKASATCPASSKKVNEVIGANFIDLTKSTDVVTFVPKEPASLADKMSAIDFIESWCKAVRAETERALFNGENVPGYKLVQGKQGNRAWSDDDQAETVLKSMRLKHEEMYDYKLISPTTAEKLFSDEPRRWKRVQELVTRSAGKPSVAPESDKRPALALTPVADHFENLTQAQ